MDALPFTDSSAGLSTTHTVTNSNVTLSTSAPSASFVESASFNGSSSYLSVSGSSDFAFGYGDFTIDFW